MNTVTHAASAFLIKRAFPKVPLVPLLIGVNLMDLFWVFFMLVGLEKTNILASSGVSSSSQTSTSEEQCCLNLGGSEPGGILQTTADINFYHIPYSHSILMALIQALIFGLLIRRYYLQNASFNSDSDDLPKYLIVGFIAVVSHLLLDIIAHDSKIEIFPFTEVPKIGFGLYGFPIPAFVVEVVISVISWLVYRGRIRLLLAILAFQFVQICGYLESCRFLINLVDCGIIWLPLAALMLIILPSVVFYLLRNKDAN